MLREVKIHDSARLPKVQFNPGKGRRGDGGWGGGWGVAGGFMTDLSEAVN